jgi:hypothetical protein
MTRLALAALLVALLLGALPAAPARAAAPSDLDLAFRWAPIHHQDTDDTDADADFVTAIDFDGDWNTLNNWENQDDDPSRLAAVAYYSVVETATHWFIVYAFYHPRDWCDVDGCMSIGEHHENDFEGILVIVRKNSADPFGQFLGMVTLAHSDLYSFTPPGSPLVRGEEDLDGTIIMEADLDGAVRPTTLQEAKGHGIKAWTGSDFDGGDHIVYFPSKTTAETPSSEDDRNVKYKLVDIFAEGGLWDHRFDTQTFAGWGRFRGDNGADDAAAAPWRWGDHDDNPILTGGEPATDPAELVDIYFDGLATFSHTYFRNTYTGIPGPHDLRLGAQTPTSIQLMWNDTVLFETSYQVWRRPAGATYWTVVTLPANTSTWTDTGLNIGAGVTYKARACYDGGCLAFSDQVTGHAGWKKLTVTRSGKGTVTSTPSGIICGVGGAACIAHFPPGTAVTLRATGHIAFPEIWDFSHWTGACTGAATTCTLTMSADRSAKATFVQGSVPTDPTPPPGGEQP